MAFVLTLAIILTTAPVTVNPVASAATDELSRIYVTGFNTSIKIHEGEKLTQSLFKKLKIKVKGQTQAGNAVKSVTVKCAEVGNYLHSKSGKVTLHLSADEASTSIAVPVKVKAKKLTVKVKGSLSEGQILTDQLLYSALKASVTYKDGKKVSNFKGYTCKKVGSVIKSSNGKIKLPIAVGNVKKTVTVKVNKIQRIFIGNCKLLATGITEGTSVEEIEESFRGNTTVYAGYAKGANKKLVAYSVKVTVVNGTVVVTVKYGKFSDKISIPVVAATPAPTQEPTTEPSVAPSVEPSQVPTDEPSASPSVSPSVSPNPTSTPGGNGGGSGMTPIDPVTPNPTTKPSASPSAKPSTEPTVTPTPEYTVTVLSNHPTVKLNDSDMQFSDNTATEVVKSGTEISLSVQDSSNARYMRMINADTGEELSTSKYHKFTVTDNITIMVVFEEVYTVTVKKVGGKGKVSISGNELDFYGDEATVQLIPGRHTLSAVAADGYKVTKWMDANGKDITTNASYTLAIPGDTTYTVVFAEEEKTVNVTYKHDNGEVIASDAVIFGESLTPPTSNVWRSDKTFVAWMLNNVQYKGKYTDSEFYADDEKTLTLTAAIKAQTAQKQDVVITPVYEENPPQTYTLTLNGGTFDSPNDVKDQSVGEFLPKTLVTAVATDVPGKNFAGWADKNGKIKSQDLIYSFYTSSEDVELTATWSDVEVEKVPIVTLDSYKMVPEDNQVTFEMSCHIPTDSKFKYEKLNWGLLVSYKTKDGVLVTTGENIKVGAEGVLTIQNPANATDMNVDGVKYNGGFSPANFDNNTPIEVRVFMNITSTKGAETVYSENTYSIVLSRQ